jgi:hypothetical protein
LSAAEETMMRSMIGALAVLALVAQPLAAQPARSRLLAVPATASWQHAETSMILPPTAAGLTRGEIRDNGEAEMDVTAGYADPASGITATISLYRTMTPQVALWFDRALTRITPAGAPPPAVTGFARPGASTPGGLRAAIDVAAPQPGGTALAVVPLGDWLLKIRLTAPGLDRAALDERLTRFIAALHWPAETSPARAAVPIEPCPSPLRFRTARLVRSDMAGALMDALGGITLSEDEHRPPPVYCREPGATPAYGVYRPDGARNRYLLALGDAGIALSLGPALDLSALTDGGSAGERYSMTLLDRTGTAVLPSFNRLPPPEQALAVASVGGPALSVSVSPPR